MIKQTVMGAAVFAALAAGQAGPAMSQTATEAPPKAQSIEITTPWARATPGRVPNGAAYLTLRNRGRTADRLVGVASPAAGRLEVHTHIREGGVMRMRKVSAVDLPPGATVTFKPGGYHVMLMGLKAPLKEGGRFPMTLRFEKAGSREVTVKVMGIGAMGPDGGHRGGQ